MKLILGYLVLIFNFLVRAEALELVGGDTSKILQVMRQLDDYYREQTWSQEDATNYINELIQKHGEFMKTSIENTVTQDSHPDNDEEIVTMQRWFVGEPSLKKFDKSMFMSMTKKLKDLWPSTEYLFDKWAFQDLGIYFISISDTNIFG